MSSLNTVLIEKYCVVIGHNSKIISSNHLKEPGQPIINVAKIMCHYMEVLLVEDMMVVMYLSTITFNIYHPPEIIF